MSVLDKIREAGVVGVGGAGFPTHMKYKSNVPTPIEHLIINAAECEPLLKTDQYNMRHHAQEVVKAVSIIKETLGATNAIIATKRYYTQEVLCLRAAIEGLDADVSLHLLDNYYPSGDEFLLVYEITGKRVPPMGIPLMVGCVVSNVSTMLNVYHAVTSDRAVTHKRITVTGHLNSPTLLEVPVGTSFETCVQAAGGTTLDDYLFIDGGPMMGSRHTKEELAGRVVSKRTSAIIVVPNEGKLKQNMELSLDDLMGQAEDSCIGCSLCTDICPRQMVGHKIFPDRVMNYFGQNPNKEVVDTEVLHGALLCYSCAVCETIACPRGLSPKKINLHVKKVFREKGITYKPSQTEELMLPPDTLRDVKAVTPHNILIKMGLLPYTKHKMDTLKTITVDEVFVPLDMHVGAASIPKVEVGDNVVQGDVIAVAPTADTLGSNIHASISGVVKDVSKTHIHITI